MIAGYRECSDRSLKKCYFSIRVVFSACFIKRSEKNRSEAYLTVKLANWNEKQFLSKNDLQKNKKCFTIFFLNLNFFCRVFEAFDSQKGAEKLQKTMLE